MRAKFVQDLTNALGRGTADESIKHRGNWSQRWCFQLFYFTIRCFEATDIFTVEGNRIKFDTSLQNNGRTKKKKKGDCDYTEVEREMVFN
jgi:hypothetical protein